MDYIRIQEVVEDKEMTPIQRIYILSLMWLGVLISLIRPESTFIILVAIVSWITWTQYVKIRYGYQDNDDNRSVKNKNEHA